ncbi:MAG: Zn-dependent protease with chaperone function [Limisphaerales bacterium]
MNFFQAQDNARRKTWQLAAMFGAAVVTLIILTNLLVAITFGATGTQVGMTFAESLANIPLDTWFWVSGGVVGLVGVASLYKYLSIQGGGRTIAEALGGHPISHNTENFEQRQLLNVVEEMAIAAGISVPPVYLIPEASINAFAAGFSPEDAVIGINQGTLDILDREELQGVVAHEFSHILNGDTNINLRLIAVLHGILFIGIIGYGLLRAGGFSRRNGMPIIALGAGLALIGYGGTFFGNMIKAGVSRQREYLADASAVQFTRNPAGIADALKKIGGFSAGSTMESESAQEVSHMFFGSVKQNFAGLFSTHPPLDQRIKAIDPSWAGTFPNVQPGFQIDHKPREASGTAGFAGAQPNTPPEFTERVGRPDLESLEVAQQLISDNGPILNNAAHDPYDARALIYCMLLDESSDIRTEQLNFLEEAAERGITDAMDRIYPHVQKVDEQHQLTLLETSIPALKSLSKPQYQRFTQNTARLITADGLVDAFEWVLHRLLTHGLRSHFEGPQRTHGRIKKISKVSAEAAKLLSILATLGQSGTEEQMRAYQAGASELKLTEPFSLQNDFDYQRMNQALKKLRELNPLQKPMLLKACAKTVMADDTVTTRESALMQGIAATLDCPLPPNVLKTPDDRTT